MYSSENNTYPLLYHQSSSLANNVIIPESNSTFFQHSHGKHSYMLPIQPPISPIQDNNHIAKLSYEPSIYQQNSILYPSNMMINHITRRAPGKKDRHTKISTAQGVRDRRVRLSISIARDFFDLQDMLGFDKASKTVGWLMAKSKAAINELISTSSKKNEEIIHIEDTNVDDGGGEKEALGVKSCTNKKRNRRNSLNALNVTMEMKRREEARNRARERTRNKKLGGGAGGAGGAGGGGAGGCGGGGDHMNQLQQQHQSGQQELMIFQSSSATTNGVISNRISSKDDQESCNYNNDYFNKFTSESSNYGGIPGLNCINLSEIHINDRSWDNYNSQFPH